MTRTSPAHTVSLKRSISLLLAGLATFIPGRLMFARLVG